MSPLAESNTPIGGREAKSVRAIWNMVTALLEEVELVAEETLDVEDVSIDEEREADVEMAVDEEVAIPRLPHSK